MLYNKKSQFLKIGLTGVLLIFIAAYFLTSCSRSSNKSSQKTKTSTDAMLRQVAVPHTVKRIVSMAPNITEMLFAIGLDQEVVGVTKFCDYPESVKNRTIIGGYYDPNIETILALAPDLIVATPDGYSKERIGKLEQSGITIFIVNPQQIREVLDTMLELGIITGRKQAAEQVVKELSKRIKVVQEKAKAIPAEKRPKVFYEIGKDPLITAGPETFVDSLISAAGGINIARDAPTPWPRYSVESVIIKKPDIILTAPHVLSTDNAGSTVSDWHRYRTMPAVKNERIYPVDPDILLRAGPRIVDGLETLSSIFTSL